MKQNKELIFRNEWKHTMDQGEYMTIRSRLAAIADESLYAGLGGRYRVRSLSFSEGPEAAEDLLTGIGKRESYRIRYYNENEDFIRLEKKTHVGGKTNKQSVAITGAECRSILAGEFHWLEQSDEPLAKDFFEKLQSGKLQVGTVADFQREAFVYKPCNVRITLDCQLQTGISADEFLMLERAVDCGQYKEAILMEVKYDCCLPEIIRRAIRIKNERSSSFSRYETRHAFGQV